MEGWYIRELRYLPGLKDPRERTADVTLARHVGQMTQTLDFKNVVPSQRLADAFETIDEVRVLPNGKVFYEGERIL